MPRTFPESRSQKRIGRLLPLIFLLALCSAATFFGQSATSAAQGKEDWARTVDAYMKAMQAKDYGRAYGLFSPEARRQFPRSELETLGKGPLQALFDGYLEIEITGWEISVQLDGTYVELNGTVTYSGGYRGRFDGMLAQAEEAWRLQFVNVVAPPEKINAYAIRNS